MHHVISNIIYDSHAFTCTCMQYNHLVGVVCKSLSLDTPPQPEGFAEADSSTKRQVLRDRMKVCHWFGIAWI